MSQLAGGLLVGIGGLLGLGGAVLLVKAKKGSRVEQKTQTADQQNQQNQQNRPEPEPEPKQQPAGKEAKFHVLGTRTRYLTERHPLHDPLYMLKNRLVKAEERQMFHEAVADIDNILALVAVLSGGQVSSVADVPEIAMVFNTRAQRLLRAIVEFSATTMPSETKKQDMSNLVSDIAKMLDDTVRNMQRTLAAMDTEQLAK